MVGGMTRVFIVASLISVGLIGTAVGQSKQTDPLNTPRTCGFHDHNQPTTTSLQGTIRIQ